MGRGGQDADEGADEAKGENETRRLPKQEIINKLNRIPVFCIATGPGNLLCATDGAEGKEPFVVWHTDAEMARELLKQAQAKIPNASLECLPLGMVVAVAAGWAQTGQPFKFRIATSDVALATYGKTKGLSPEELKGDDWVTPVFFSDKLVRKDGFPIFFHPEHMAKAWQEMLAAKATAGEEAPSGEMKMQTANLLTLVEHMATTDDNEWSAFLFIGAKSSLDLAVECNEKKSGGDGGGGEAAQGEQPSPAAVLERKKRLVAALSGIPVFTLANAKGEVYMRQDPQTGEQNIPWMIDGATALGHLKALQEQGKTTTRLITQPLGEIFAVLSEWKRPLTPAAMTLTSYAEGVQLYRRGIAGTPKEAEMGQRKWIVPVFYCRELFTEERKLVFLHHADLIAAHKKKRAADAAKRENGEEGAEEKETKLQLAILELRELAGLVLQGHEEWTNVTIIGPSSAKEAILTITNAAPPDPKDEPPQLDEAAAAAKGGDDSVSDAPSTGASAPRGGEEEKEKPAPSKASGRAKTSPLAEKTRSEGASSVETPPDFFMEKKSASDKEGLSNFMVFAAVLFGLFAIAMGIVIYSHMPPAGPTSPLTDAEPSAFEESGDAGADA